MTFPSAAPARTWLRMHRRRVLVLAVMGSLCATPGCGHTWSSWPRQGIATPEVHGGFEPDAAGPDAVREPLEGEPSEEPFSSDETGDRDADVYREVIVYLSTELRVPLEMSLVGSPPETLHGLAFLDVEDLSIAELHEMTDILGAEASPLGLTRVELSACLSSGECRVCAMSLESGLASAPACDDPETAPGADPESAEGSRHGI